MRATMRWTTLVGVGAILGWLGAGVVPRSTTLQAADEGSSTTRQWVKGKGWGWVWGADDEVGSLNEMTDTSRLAALRSVAKGKVYDLGALYSRNSFKWPGHSPGEIISFRGPIGVLSQKDVEAFASTKSNPARLAWHSNALFINDNVATQIDGLGHVTVGQDMHWYNGYTEGQWGGDFGVRKCDANSIPPIIARGVLLDIADLKGVPVLPSSYTISIEDIRGAMDRQKTKINPGDVVLLRTGTLSLWDIDGADHAALAAHDSAGPDIVTVKYLVEQLGAILIGSDTSGLERSPAPEGSDCPVPVHKYLLIEQGIHIGEFHNLEQLSRDKVYEFCYVALTNKIAGSTAGFALRPIAIR